MKVETLICVYSIIVFKLEPPLGWDRKIIMNKKCTILCCVAFGSLSLLCLPLFIPQHLTAGYVCCSPSKGIWN